MIGEWRKFKHRYLGVDISSDGGMDEKVNHRITEVKKRMRSIERLMEKEAYISRGKSRNALENN